MRQPAPDILTVDYEDWFHILRPGFTDPEAWRHLPSHVERDTESLLDLLDRHEVRATFFVLGWMASRTPDIIREIARRGHELASHGYSHVPPDDMSEAEFRRDLLESIEVLRDLGAGPVRGFRAPGFGVGRCCFPYQQVLVDCGLEYDASLFPGWYPGHGTAGGSLRPHRKGGPNGDIWEVPVSALKIMGIPVAFSGGGFLRLLPGWCVRLGASRVRTTGCPTIFYIHPRDLNPKSPMIRTQPWNRWRYYGGRRRMKQKVTSILEGRSFVSIEHYLGLDRERRAS